MHGLVEWYEGDRVRYQPKTGWFFYILETLLVRDTSINMTVLVRRKRVFIKWKMMHRSR